MVCGQGLELGVVHSAKVGGVTGCWQIWVRAIRVIQDFIEI